MNAPNARHRSQKELEVAEAIAALLGVEAELALLKAGVVINIDQSLEVAPFADLIRSLADRLRGPGFAGAWEIIAASMHIELLDGAAQELVRSISHPRQDLILAYWQELFDRPVNEIEDFVAVALAAVRAAAVPYLVVAGAELEPDYQKWLGTVLPQALSSYGREVATSLRSLTPTSSLSAWPVRRAGRQLAETVHAELSRQLQC